MTKRKEPDARTIGPVLAGVTQWKALGFNPAILCTISKKYPYSKLRGATVQIVGPGESCLKKARIVNRIIVVNNTTLMTKIVRMENKSVKYSIGDLLEVKPRFLKTHF